MKTITLILLAISMAATAFAQDGPYMKGDTLITSIGMKIYPGLRLNIGKPAQDRTKFSYLGAYATWGDNGIGRAWAGYETEVKKIKAQGTKKMGERYIVVTKLQVINCLIDIENALATGEIIPPKEFRQQPKSSEPMSIADELKKFKELLDAGAITQDEYDAAKKKLLGSN